ncbi:MAG: class II aldolase/adducin family protein [Pseudomonadota bacterium]
MAMQMAFHALDTDADAEPIGAAKIDLAAALRLAAYHDLQEGIDNHFTVTAPGYDDRFIMLPFGYHWSEARASDMIIFDEAGNTLEGDGVVEMTAQCIHAPIHRITGKRVVMHTHQTWAVALNMLEDNRLLPASQTAALFSSLIAYDDEYTGLATMLEEGERLAAALGDKTVLFMKSHGIMVATNSIASAFRLLYLLERVCKAQVLAMSTGKPLAMVAPEVVERLQIPSENDRHMGMRPRLYFEAMKRVLDREMPGYAE